MVYTTMFIMMTVGMLLAFLVRARNYILDGTFSGSVWIKDNATRVGWVIIMAALLTVVMYIDPSQLAILETIGLSIDPNNFSPVLIGILLTQMIHTVSKTEIGRNKTPD